MNNILAVGSITLTHINDGTNGSNFLIFSTNYNYAQADIDKYSTVGYKGAWTVVESTTRCKVNDSIALKVYNNTKKCSSLILATVNSINGVDRITCTSTGLIESGANGANGTNGTNGITPNFNLIRNSAGNLNNTSYWSNCTLDTSEMSTKGWNSFKLTRTNYAEGNPRFQMVQSIPTSTLSLKPNDYVTLSGWIYVSSSIALSSGANTVSLRNHVNSGDFEDLCVFNYNNVAKNTWTYFKVTSKATKVTGHDSLVLGSIEKNGLIWLTRLKLEKGTTASEWLPTVDELKGTNGVGIKSITEYYLASASNSGVTTSTSGWTTTIQNISASKKYLWNYEVIRYTNDSTTTGTPRIIGAYGDPGTNGATPNFNILMETNKGTRNWSWSMQTGGCTATEVYEDGISCCKMTRNTVAQSGWSVIGYSYINRNAYKTNTKYTISFEVKSSVTSSNISAVLRCGNATGSMTSEVSVGSIPVANVWTKMVGTFTTVSTFPTETNQIVYMYGFNSNVGVSHTFRNLKIEEGTVATPWLPNVKELKGTDGVGIKSVTNYYLASTASSGVTASTAGWTTAIQDISLAKRYLWNYEVITYTNDTKTTTTPVIIGVYGATGPQGPTGPTGAQGPQGNKGDKGDKGDDAVNNEKQDGVFADGITFWSSNYNSYVKPGSNVTVIKSSKQPKYGENVLNIVNEQWLYAKNKITIKPEAIYKFVFRVRQEASTDSNATKVYAGATEFNSAGAKISQYNGTYFVVAGSPVAQSTSQEIASGNYRWVEYTTYMSTKARAAIVDKKGVTYFNEVKAFTSGVSTIRPMLIVNYQGGTGTAQVDALMVEEVTDFYEAAVLKKTTSELSITDNEINAKVTSINTIVDKVGNPMKLGIKKEYSDFNTANEGEFFIHGLDANNKPADINGSCMWPQTINGTKKLAELNLPKQMYNPNGKVPYKTPIFIVRDIAGNKWWSLWKEEVETTVTWKKMHANQSTDGNIYTHTWAASDSDNLVFVGYYMTETQASESKFMTTQLFESAMPYEQAINTTVQASYGQVKVLSDEVSMKVDNNGVIAAINLYTQTDNQGTNSVVKIQGNKIDLQGQVTFSSLADTNTPESIKNIFTQDSNRTVINGGMIKTNTIKGNDLLLKGNLTVSKTVNNKVVNTFAIKEDGNVEIDGILKSSNFSESYNTGYRITTDGTAIFNQAQIKGDVILARAGMTNYGGQIGNSNELLNSNFYNGTSNWSVSDMSSGGTNKSITRAIGGSWAPSDAYVLQMRGTNTTNRYGVSQYFILKPKTTYTVSGYCAGHRVGNLRVTIRDAENSDAHVHNYVITPVVGGNSFSKYAYFSTTFTTTSSKRFGINLYTENFKEDGYAWWGNLKLEEGSQNTPWCSHPTEQNRHVRIWAGAEYEKRENAPFRVYQNGDIYATNGTFSGRVLGHFDSGNIHIDNGEFVINSTNTVMTARNQIVEYSDDLTRDAKANPYIMFSSTKNFINTDLIFGTTDNARIKYSNTNNSMDINIPTTINTGTTAISVEKTTAWSDGVNLSSRLASNSGSFTFNFRKDSDSLNHVNTLFAISKGGKGTVYGDMCLRRKDWEEDFDLRIRGNLQITNKISSDKNTVELRSTSTGWGFYVV